MALGRSRGRRASIDIWPGFVDALAQLLMVIIFILLVFTVGQFYLSDALSGRDEALKQLQQKISALADELALEKQTSETLRGNAASLQAELKAARDEKDALTAKLSAAQDLQTKLTAAQQTTQADKAQVENLTAEIASLKDQLAKIAAALDASSATVKNQQDQIVELGKKLNLALANKVEELARYRSEFFGKLSEILGNRPDIRVVGDRFVFQAEVLFTPGGADLSDDAKKQLDPVFAALKQIADQIPPDLHWVLEVDGHTDHRPIHTDQFASNWELSTERAISVVRYAITQGIPADHLAAAGFADKQPIDTDNSDDAFRKNRRIELKLTER